MPRTFIDLSVTLEDKPMEPAHHAPKIEAMDHDSEAAWSVFETYYPGVPHDAMVDGKAWASERVTLITHAGTHMDAPWHYHPTMNHALKEGGEPSSTIDQVPLEWCFGPGVKLDFRHFEDGYVATGADVEAELARIGHELQPLEIVLVNTSANGGYDAPDYMQRGCGMGREATLYLLERGVRVVGTDALGWDAPFSYTAKLYAETGDTSIIWEGHKAGREIGYYQMEKLTNLDKLPSTGFTVSCFPVKLGGASAAWTRVVGMLDA